MDQDLVTKYKTLESGVSKAKDALVRYEVDLEQAKNRLEALKVSLKEEFDVETAAEARDLLDCLKAQLQDELMAVELELGDAR